MHIWFSIRTTSIYCLHLAGVLLVALGQPLLNYPTFLYNKVIGNKSKKY